MFNDHVQSQRDLTDGSRLDTVFAVTLGRSHCKEHLPPVARQHQFMHGRTIRNEYHQGTQIALSNLISGLAADAPWDRIEGRSHIF